MKFAHALLLVATLLLAGCPEKSPPASTADASAPADASAQSPDVADAGAPMPDATTGPDAPIPSPPEPGDGGVVAGTNDVGAAAPSIAIGEPHPGAPTVVDRGCQTDADCAIKDVGSCCGYAPACVNKASPTFPEQVQAQCAKSGRMGICGFPAITGCKCTAGQCEGTGADADPRNRIQ
jgi:hypothetical protein